MCPQYIRKVLGAITTMCTYNVGGSWIWGRTRCHVADEDLGGTLCRFSSTNPARRAATEGTLRSEPGFQAMLNSRKARLQFKGLPSQAFLS